MRPPQIGGNSTDIERIKNGLTASGHEVLVARPDEINRQVIIDFKPNIVHGFHAYKSRIGLQISKENKIPLIITLTGTDYNEDIKTGKNRKILEVLGHASAITTLNNGSKEVAIKNIPQINGKVSPIMRGDPGLCETDKNFRKETGIKEDDFAFFFIGGIRLVKNPVCPVKPLGKLREEFPSIKLIYVGSILEPEMWEDVKHQIKKEPWIKYIGEIERVNIKAVLSASDAIINCSFSEGENNVIFEAMCSSKPVIASDIPGNTVMIKNGINGLIFRDEADFTAKARKLVSDKSFRKKISDGAREEFMNRVNVNEIQEYIDIYQKSTAD